MSDDIKNNDTPDDDMNEDFDDHSMDFDDLDDLNDWDDEDSDSNFDELNQNSKQSTAATGVNWFNIILIGGVVLVVGGFAYSFLMGGNNDTQPQQTSVNRQPAQTEQPQIATQEEQQNLAQAALSNEDVAVENPLQGLMDNPAGLLSNLDQLDTLDNDQPTNPVVEKQDPFADLDVSTTPVLSSDSLADIYQELGDQENIQTLKINDKDVIADNTNQKPLPNPADEIETQTYLDNFTNLGEMSNIPSAPQSPDAEIIETLSISDAVEPPMEFVEQERQMQDISPAASNSLNIQIDETFEKIEASIESLSNRLDDITNKIDDMATISPAPPSPQVQNNISAVNQDILTNMAQTITALEAKIETLENTKPEVKITPAPNPAPAQRQTTPRQNKNPVVRTAPQPKIEWDLRGAGQGEAYIAQKNTQNLRTIRVGENIEGLGRIQSIAPENGRWVVRGTNGIIRQ